MTKEVKTGFNPDKAIPPGETLQKYLDALAMSQMELAQRTGLSTKMLNAIIKGKAPITPETALKLESVFSTPANFWSNLEAIFQETRARRQAETDIDQETQTAGSIPYAELARRGFVQLTNHPREKVVQLRQFFGVASLKYLPAIMPVAFRKLDKQSGSPYSLAAWIRMGELMAGEIETLPYNAKRLKQQIPALRELTWQEDEVASQLEDLCAFCGVATVVVPYLPKAYAQGATKWLQPGKAMVQLNTKYEFADMFWFCFFHQLGHILLHSKKTVFAEIGEKSREEAEADQFAAECLIPGSKYRAFLKKNNYSRDAIVKFANRIKIDPRIVVGRLNQDHIIDRSEFQDLQ